MKKVKAREQLNRHHYGKLGTNQLTHSHFNSDVMSCYLFLGTFTISKQSINISLSQSYSENKRTK